MCRSYDFDRLQSPLPLYDPDTLVLHKLVVFRLLVLPLTKLLDLLFRPDDSYGSLVLAKGELVSFEAVLDLHVLCSVLGLVDGAFVVVPDQISNIFGHSFIDVCSLEKGSVDVRFVVVVLLEA